MSAKQNDKYTITVTVTERKQPASLSAFNTATWNMKDAAGNEVAISGVIDPDQVTNKGKVTFAITTQLANARLYSDEIKFSNSGTGAERRTKTETFSIDEMIKA